MGSVTVEDHGNKKYGLRVTNSGRAQVDSDTTDTIERNLDLGKIFFVRRALTSIADDGYNQILLYTGTSGAASGGFTSAEAYTVVNAASGGNAELEIYESPTVTASGTQLTVYNKTRSSSVTAKSTAFHTPTVTISGTRMVHRIIPSGGGEATEGDQYKDAPIVFDADKNYLISVKNIAGSAQPNSIALTWIEKA